ncbi:winged helix DNA-binding domain-containing protein [Prauserella cavernicola]|uniref:AlkZ family DNA glycosylase n=1 Tax=Prauserella cavernicola TaxID=2800127 RepID=A0A934R0Q3_9PSEU|nr:winged helix DNA-binding domain-containing protein [Prauserella cavernicola]MBK1788959.1 AlkZ family DNA glycosylase [Prauserella cavernicola]
MLDVDRRQVLAYRIAAHGLHREVADPDRLAVFDLGVQDVTKRDTAVLALVARLPDAARAQTLLDDAGFTLGWTHRGAPHYHRSAEFRALIPALLPLDDADAEVRMLWQRKEIAAAGLPGTTVLHTAATALRDVVGEPMTKGAASTEVTTRIPEGLSRWCRGCQATHIHEQLMRLATPIAGIRLEPGTSPATLAPLAKRPRIPTTADVAGATRIVQSYLRLHGPATASDAAGFVGTTRTTVADRLWPADLAEVTVDGRPAFLPAEHLPELENPPEPAFVRLLPPWDPLLQARDRAVLVPDKAHQKELWKILGNPGAILADGEIAGFWRTRSAGKRLEFTMTELWPLPTSARAATEQEAERVAQAREYGDLRITWA